MYCFIEKKRKELYHLVSNCYPDSKKWKSPICQKTRLDIFSLFWESTPWANLWIAEQCWECRRIHNTAFLFSISIPHHATILPQLCHCVCRLLNICIKINMTANAKPAIFPSRKRSSRRYDKSCALFSDPVGSITFAATHRECVRFTRPYCWHVDRW